MDTITPTPEFIRQHKDTYQAPETNQTTKRDYGRLRPWYETAVLKGTIRKEHAEAARDLDMYWHAVNDPRGCTGSYGDQRWNGTPMSQVNTHTLLGPEWREHCRARLKDAKAATGRHFDVLEFCCEFQGTAYRVGQLMGYNSKSQAIAKGGAAMRQGLHTLAIRWGYLSAFHPPTG